MGRGRGCENEQQNQITNAGAITAGEALKFVRGGQGRPMGSGTSLKTWDRNQMMARRTQLTALIMMVIMNLIIADGRQLSSSY
jgi:hypothetical protein